MQGVFSGWADIVSKRTLLVFLASLSFFIILSGGMMMSKEYEDQSVIWTPKNNPSLQAKDKGEALFDGEEKFRYISVIFESKDPEENILNPAALMQMAKL